MASAHEGNDATAPKPLRVADVRAEVSNHDASTCAHLLPPYVSHTDEPLSPPPLPVCTLRRQLVDAASRQPSELHADVASLLDAQAVMHVREVALRLLSSRVSGGVDAVAAHKWSNRVYQLLKLVAASSTDTVAGGNASSTVTATHKIAQGGVAGATAKLGSWQRFLRVLMALHPLCTWVCHHHTSCDDLRGTGDSVGIRAVPTAAAAAKVSPTQRMATPALTTYPSFMSPTSTPSTGRGDVVIDSRGVLCGLLSAASGDVEQWLRPLLANSRAPVVEESSHPSTPGKDTGLVRVHFSGASCASCVCARARGVGC